MSFIKLIGGATVGGQADLHPALRFCQKAAILLMAAFVLGVPIRDPLSVFLFFLAAFAVILTPRLRTAARALASSRPFTLLGRLYNSPRWVGPESARFNRKLTG